MKENLEFCYPILFLFKKKKMKKKLNNYHKKGEKKTHANTKSNEESIRFSLIVEYFDVLFLNLLLLGKCFLLEHTN